MTPDIKKVQRLLGVREDGDWGPISERALDEKLGINPMTPTIPADYFDKLAKIESGDRPYVKAATSSASGLYQFLKATWIGEGGTWGASPTEAFGGLLPSNEEQTKRARTFTQKNANALAAANVPVTAASLYAAHFLGIGTAIRALGQADDTPIEQVTAPAQRAANPSIIGPGKTVGDFRKWLDRKTA